MSTNEFGYLKKAENSLYTKLITELGVRKIKYDELKKLGIDFPNWRGAFPNAESPIELSRIKTLDLYLNLELDEYVLDQDAEDLYFDSHLNPPLNKNKFLTNSTLNDIKSVRKSDSIIHAIHINNNDTLSKAYNLICDYASRASSSITVHETCFKGNNSLPEAMEQYTVSHKNFLGAIATVISQKMDEGNEDFRYERIFHLSPFEEVQLGNIRDKHKVRWSLEASKNSIVHVFDCLNRYSKNCRFSICDGHLFQSHCIIDEKFLITEEYHRSSHGIVPVTLFVSLVEPNAKLRPKFTGIQSSTKQHRVLDIDSPETIMELLNQTYSLVLKRKNQKAQIEKALKIFGDGLDSDYTDMLYEREIENLQAILVHEDLLYRKIGKLSIL